MNFEHIITLGSFGKRFAERYVQKYGTTRITTIGNESNCDIVFPLLFTHEEYDQMVISEENVEKLKKCESMRNLVVLDPSETISGATLNTLQYLKDGQNDVLLYFPRKEQLRTVRMSQLRVTASVLQEYSRSGALGECWLLSETAIEKKIKPTIQNRQEKLVEFVVDLLYSFCYYEKAEVLLGDKHPFPEHYRIGTIGHIEHDEETMFYPFIHEHKYRHYFYVVPFSKLNAENVYERLEKFTKEHNFPSLTVHTIEQECEEFVYFIEKCSEVQKV